MLVFIQECSLVYKLLLSLRLCFKYFYIIQFFTWLEIYDNEENYRVKQNKSKLSFLCVCLRFHWSQRNLTRLKIVIWRPLQILDQCHISVREILPELQPPLKIGWIKKKKLKIKQLDILLDLNLLKVRNKHFIVILI